MPDSKVSPVTLFVTLRPMYDTVKLTLATLETEGIANLLTNPKETINKVTGECLESGYMENLLVKVSGNSVTICGSLSKFVNGNNVERLTRKATELAIEKLSDLLKLSLHQANVYRLDVAETLILKRPVREYLGLLGDSRYYDRCPQGKRSLLYRSDQRAKAFYGKIHEMHSKKKGENIPEVFQGRNALTYELRFLKRLARQFKRKAVKASDLFEQNFYIQAVDHWLKEYSNIKKHLRPRIDTMKLQGVKDLDNQIYLMLMEQIGGDIGDGAKVLFEMFENERARGNLDRMKHKRFRDKINRVISNPRHFDKNDCIEELDQKIRQAAKYYR